MCTNITRRPSPLTHNYLFSTDIFNCSVFHILLTLSIWYCHIIRTEIIWSILIWHSSYLSVLPIGCHVEVCVWMFLRIDYQAKAWSFLVQNRILGMWRKMENVIKSFVTTATTNIIKSQLKLFTLSFSIHINHLFGSLSLIILNCH